MRVFVVLFLFAHSFISVGQEKIVKINGNDFNVLVMGLEQRKASAPVIILESGMGVNLSNWKSTMDQISTFAPVLAYERAGIGKSGKVFKMPTPKFVSL